MSLSGGRRLPSQLLVGLEGSGGGRLGGGGSAGWLSDPLRPSTSSIRAPSLSAGVLPTVHQGSRLNPGASDPSSEGGSRTSPSVSGFLQPSIPRPEGFWVVAPHHRSVDPERLHHLVALPHGDSSVSPSFHSPRRLDGLPGPAGRLPAGSSSSRFASLSSLRGSREVVPVQGPLLRSYNRAPSLHEDYGSSFRHPPQVRGQDASLPGRLAHPGLYRTRLFTIEGQAPVNLHRTWHPGLSLSLPAPDVSFFSDASDVGWGALVGEHHASGLWSPHQKTFSINLRELLAVQYGLKALEHLLVGLSVALFCDNTTTVSYLRRSGGTFSSTLNATAREILLWAENHRVRLLPQFIMGSSNVTADALSRPNQVIGSEWALHQEVVDQLVHKWPAVIDLFAKLCTLVTRTKMKNTNY